MQGLKQRAAVLLGMTLAVSQWLPGCLVADDGHPPIEGSGASSSAGGGAGGSQGGGASPSGGGTVRDAGTSGAGGVIGGGGGTGGVIGGGGGTGGVRIDAGAGGTGGLSGGGGSAGSAAGAAGGSSTDPCTAFAFPSTYGLSCGANLTPGADRTRLYLCDGTKTSASVVCPQGCHAAPVGQDDYCIGVDMDPCMNNTFPSSAGTATWCAANLLSTLDPNVLYSCDGQSVAFTTSCSNGCHASPPGQADYCN